MLVPAICGSGRTQLSAPASESGSMDGDVLPFELQNVPEHVLLVGTAMLCRRHGMTRKGSKVQDRLQGYVERCLERVAGSASLAQRLRVSSNQLQSAVQNTFEELYRPELRAGPGSQLKLVFRHECL